MQKDQIKKTVTQEELAQAFTGEVATPAEKPKKKSRISERTLAIFLIAGAVLLVAGCAMMVFGALNLGESESYIDYPDLQAKEDEQEFYSPLTGQTVESESAINAPIYCIQTPNGTDGARPQAGLNQAGVIFEAIAEAGITRFAAIYQNPTASVVGPIRSLRIYYLEWDTPFDCTIVHAGGSGDALAAVSSGGYKDLTEDYTYMYRGTSGSRLWNNLFTTASNLKRFSTDHGYDKSEAKGFLRMTPNESRKAQVDEQVGEKLLITKPAKGNTSELKPAVTAIGLRFGGLPNYNVDYAYDANSNTYHRSYQSGVAHEVYNCPADDLGEINPESACSLVQMAPSVVVAMMVSEHRASDNYHEDIAAIGSGDVYIFQNGGVKQGTWKKSSRESQIEFVDANGEAIKLAPGQTIVSAIPAYGSVDF